MFFSLFLMTIGVGVAISNISLGKYERVAFPYFLPKLVKETNWQRIDPSDLVCPKNADQTLYTDCQEIDGGSQEIIQSHVEEIEGILCHKSVLESYCHENFWGQSTRKRIKKSSAISASECKNRISSHTGFGADNDNEFVYPPYSCSWMSTKSRYSNHISMKKLKVSWNPYKSERIHKIFLHGFCKDDECSTIHDSSIWIQTDKRQTCPPRHYVEVKIFAKDNKICYWKDLNDQIHHGKKLCKEVFCGNWMAVNEDHHAIILPKKYMDSLKVCDNNIEIAEDNLEESILAMKAAMELSLYRAGCMNIRDTVIRTNQISSNQLSYFRSLAFGVNWVYKHQNGEFFRAKAKYVTLTKLSKDKTRGEISVGPKKRKNVILKEFFQTIKWDNETMLNGIKFLESRMYIPDLDRLEKYYRSELNAMKLVKLIKDVKEPQSLDLQILSNQTERDEESEGFNFPSIDLNDPFHLKRLGLLIGLAIISPIITIAGFCICRKRRKDIELKRRLYRDLKRGDSDETLPMREYRGGRRTESWD